MLFNLTVHIKEQTDDMQHSDCQIETQCADQIKEEPSCMNSEECNTSMAVMLARLSTNHMLEKPLCSDSAGYGVSEATKLADELKEEALCSDGIECGMTGMSESAMLAGVDIEHDVKDELVLGSEHAKEEPSFSESVEYGMSEAVMLADLYADHVVKDELVLGPEHPHRPDVSLVVLDWALADADGCPQESHQHSATQLALKDCCVRLERLHHEAPAKRIIEDTAHTDSEPYTGNETYSKVDCKKVIEPLCDLYGRKFTLQSDLLKHVITHIHTSSKEQESSGSVVSDCDCALADADGCLQESQKHASATQLELKDCCVRLERLRHDALPAERTIQDTTLTNRVPYTKDEMCSEIYCEKAIEPLPLCDLCGKKFSLKSDLLKHVITHIHMSGMEQESSGSVVSDRALGQSKTSQERVLSRDSPFAFRDCCVRLERLPHHEALAGNETAQDTAHNDNESDTENIYARDCKGVLVCDLCGERFALKADLMRHVMIHIHVPTNTGSIEPNHSQYKISTNIVKKNSDIYEYVCDTCRKTFNRKYDLIRHIQITHTQANSKIIKTKSTVYECNKEDKKTYPCDTCGIHFTQKGFLITHQRIHSDKRPYSCNLCEKRFKTLSGSKIHERVHTGVKPYSCEICQRQFAQKSSIVTHMRTHTGEKPYNCEICNKRFSRSSSLILHRLTHTGVKPYSCETCDKQFKEVRFLNQHKKVHTGEKPYMCNICKKQFSALWSLSKHKVRHTGITCKICKKHFTQWEKFQIHKRTHTGGTIYTCALCNMKFINPWNFNEHKRTHTKERPYACGICGKQYTRAEHLKIHNRYHTGERPFSCKMCDKKFVERSSLISHERIHTGGKPFSCEICKKQFTQSTHLRTHLRSHTGEKPYSCEMCNKKFRYLQDCKRHKVQCI